MVGKTGVARPAPEVKQRSHPKERLQQQVLVEPIVPGRWVRRQDLMPRIADVVDIKPEGQQMRTVTSVTDVATTPQKKRTPGPSVLMPLTDDRPRSR